MRLPAFVIEVIWTDLCSYDLPADCFEPGEERPKRKMKKASAKQSQKRTASEAGMEVRILLLLRRLKTIAGPKDRYWAERLCELE